MVNEDAADGAFVDGWDIHGALRGESADVPRSMELTVDHILPHLEPLAPVFNFSVESQVLYHAPLAFEPLKSEDEGKEEWVVDEDGMKMFVSERWTLGKLTEYRG